MRTSLFVTIDGPSGVGKTTVAELLREQLLSEGRAVTNTTTPSSSVIGQLARHGTNNIRGTALSCLVAADRYHHQSSVVEPALLRGEIVLCDRFVPSSLVLDVIDGVEREYAYGLYSRIAIPDLAIVLMGDPALCSTRAASRGIYSRFHSLDINERAREREEYLAAISFLSTVNYPVYVHSIGNSDASQTAASLMAVIRDAWRAHQ